MIQQTGVQQTRVNEGSRSGQKASRPQTAPSTSLFASTVPQTRHPQFGGFGATAQAMVPKVVDRLVPTFQTITEVFLAAFLAQDVVAMWLPRIRQSLVRGAKEYHPETDPENKNLTPFQLTKRYWTKTLQGLNWVNFSEETKREFATGPGVLLIPAVVYFFASFLGFGKQAVELGYGPLTQLNDSFINHLKSTSVGQAATVSEAEFKGVLQSFIQSRFGFDEATLKLSIDNKPLSQHLAQWSTDWTEAVFKGINENATIQAAGQAELEALDKKLYELVMNGLNNGHRADAFRSKISQMEVRLSKRAQEAGKQVLKDHVHDMPITEFTSHIGRWKGFAMELFNSKVTRNVMGANKKAIPLAELAKKYYQDLVVRKGLLAIGVTLGTGYYLVQLAKWAQSHDTYEANRLLQEDTPGAGPQKPADKATPDTQHVAFKPAVSPSQSKGDFDALLNSLNAEIAKAPAASSAHGAHAAPDWTKTLPARPSIPALQPVAVTAAPQAAANYIYPTVSNPAIPSYSPPGYSASAYGPYASSQYPAQSGFQNVFSNPYQQNTLSGFYPAGMSGMGAWGVAPNPWTQGGNV